ncbi:MAG: DUF481 domain-containing protein [Planctomycetota bacterium]
MAACKAPPSRQKSDTIHLANGDRITGEIKKLEQGKLRLKTSALDTVYIQWDEVAGLGSGYNFEFEDTDGIRHFGHIVAQEGDAVTIETDEGQRIVLPLAQVVEITPIDESLWSRIDGGVSVGFDYNKGTDVANLTTSFDVQYRTRKSRSELDFSSTITSETEGERASRNSLSLGSNRYRGRWFVWGTAALETNDTLGLDLRSILSAGGGRSLISTSQNLLDLGLGIAISEEDSAGDSESASVLEGVARATYSIFRFSEREVDSDFELLVFPGITESGRVRGELDANVRREIAKNLYIELSGYYSYDNEPPGGSQRSDYGVNMSLGWSF